MHTLNALISFRTLLSLIAFGTLGTFRTCSASITFRALGSFRANGPFRPFWSLNALRAGISLISFGPLRASVSFQPLRPFRTGCAGVAFFSLDSGVSLRTLYALRSLNALGTLGALWTFRPSQRSNAGPIRNQLRPDVALPIRFHLIHFFVSGWKGLSQRFKRWIYVLNVKRLSVIATVSLLTLWTLGPLNALRPLNTLLATHTLWAALSLGTLCAGVALFSGIALITFCSGFALGTLCAGRADRALNTLGTLRTTGPFNTLRSSCAILTGRALDSLRSLGAGCAGLSLVTFRALVSLNALCALHTGGALGPLRALHTLRALRTAHINRSRNHSGRTFRKGHQTGVLVYGWDDRVARVAFVALDALYALDALVSLGALRANNAIDHCLCAIVRHFTVGKLHPRPLRKLETVRADHDVARGAGGLPIKAVRTGFQHFVLVETKVAQCISAAGLNDLVYTGLLKVRDESVVDIGLDCVSSLVKSFFQLLRSETSNVIRLIIQFLNDVHIFVKLSDGHRYTSLYIPGVSHLNISRQNSRCGRRRYGIENQFVIGGFFHFQLCPDQLGLSICAKRPVVEIHV